MISQIAKHYVKSLFNLAAVYRTNDYLLDKRIRSRILKKMKLSYMKTSVRNIVYV